MTVYPYEYDDDQTLIRIDDDITELGGQAINQLRDAVFAIERVLGIQPQGAAGSVATRLDRSQDADGDIKASALTSVGLATLPIVDNQVANTAGIKEYKLALDHSTSDLYTLILANKSLLDSLAAFTAATGTGLAVHIGGGATLPDGSPARHVASHIDINAVPTDPRDVTFNWTGIKDKDGNLRSATNVAGSLQEINDALTTHENLTTEAHPATAVTVDTTNFTEIPAAADTVQKALDAIDDSDRLQIGIHRATMHFNGIPRTARTEQIGLDGYSTNIVEVTPVVAFLVDPPSTSPVDSNTAGDDLVQFLPVDDSNFKFDEQFTQVKPGDIITINYGNGIVAQFGVESIRMLPGTEWFVRINGTNLFNTDGYTAYARIDRPAFNANTRGVLAVAAANNDIDATLLGSLVIGHPRGATALGIDFDPNQLDSTHYKLYLQLYPTGNPADKIISLPSIDVTGDAGVSPGQYTLSRVVAATNDALRAAGYNYRFIAFAHEGNFGIMLADPIGKASFSIVSGVLSGSSLSVSTYTNNVVGDAADGKDALGFGANKAALASPVYSTSFSSAEAATNLPTLVFPALRRKNFVVNGVRQDEFATTFKTVGDGYWPATITARTPVGLTTVEVSYTVNMDLCEAGLKPGKTIVVQPVVGFADAGYTDVDYGRFIIKSVSFTAACDSASATTVITVVNGIHAVGSPTGTSSSPGLAVKLYFGADSVGFNAVNVIDAAPTGTTYNRFHEIYITEDARTFSHERARMRKQTEGDVLPSGGNPLATASNWTIRDVSPKLRGWRDDASSTLNKYVRFYVLSYNTTTGEYDGYLGKRNQTNPNITNYGAITHARKNVPARFYDETNIDYIELEFFDVSGTPGVDIVAASPRYVDIEIFPTLREDEEFFYIASVEVDNKYIDNVTDRREFGNVAEENLTTSAIDFIEAGDRYMHANGVIRGFDFVGVDPSNSNRLQFEGGLALVNGHVSTVNAGSVAIPQVIPAGTVVPQTLTWAICVNDKNEFVAILLTTIKEQFFAQLPGGGSNYYIPSVTFAELIATRKDLVPIYTAVVTIASFTVNSVFDVRRYIADETLNTPFTWVPSPELGSDTSVVAPGHFKSFDAVKAWINYYGVQNNTVKVRGTHYIDATTGSIDLRDLVYPTTIEGENAIFYVTTPVGMYLGSGVTLRKLSFFYDPVGITYGVLGRINVGVGLDPASTTGACLLGEGTGSSTFQDIVIDRCNFSTTLDSGFQRPAHILFLLNKGDLVDGLEVTKNKFYDGELSPGQCAFAVVNSNQGSSTTAATIANVLIDGNICNREQGIHLTTISQTTYPTFPKPGLHASNVRVSHNECGVIGYLLSNDPANRNANVRGKKTWGLSITDNTARFIGRTAGSGYYILIKDVLGTDFIEYGSPSVVIKDNHCHWIHTHQGEKNDAFQTYQFGGLLIEGNMLDGYDETFLLDMFDGVWIGLVPTAKNYAIHVDSPWNYNTTPAALTTATGGTVITGNSTRFGYYDGKVYGYDSCIVAGTQCITYIAPWFVAPFANLAGVTITDNDLGGINDTAASINPPHFLNTIIAVDAARGIVSGNRLIRDAASIFAYVSSLSLDADSSVMVVDNFFDKYFVTNGFPTSTNVIYVGNVTWIADRNKNQTVVTEITGNSGQVTLGLATSGKPTGSAPTGTEYMTGSYTGLTINHPNTSAVNSFWGIDLFGLLPPWVTLLSVTVTARVDVVPGAGSVSLAVSDVADGSIVAGPQLFNSTSDKTLTISPGWVNYPANKLTVFVSFTMGNTSGSTVTITADPLSVTYRY